MKTLEQTARDLLVESGAWMGKNGAVALKEPDMVIEGPVKLSKQKSSHGEDVIVDRNGDTVCLVSQSGISKALVSAINKGL